MISRVLHSPINGRLTALELTKPQCSYEVAKAQDGSNLWSSTENSRSNARNVNFNSGSTNNNNRYNSNVVRPVVASIDYVPEDFVCSVWEAYHDCLRHKMRSPQAVEYMVKAADDIPRLAHELWTGTYSPGTSTCFLVRYPKLREVFAASFRDRIVHHWVCLRLNPLFEHRFRRQGDVSFNCRKGFGTDSAVRYVAEGMRRVSGNYRREAWVFRGDLEGFFMSIDKELLWGLLERFVLRWRRRAQIRGWCHFGLAGQPEMYWDVLTRTVRQIVMHRPERDCVMNSPEEWWQSLPRNKSLFTSASGMPIGNLTTQLFANFLMSWLVTYVRWLLRGRNYEVAQFVDDFVIVCDDKRVLLDAIPKIEAFLRERLHLRLHKDKRYLQPVSHGVLFVGTYIKPGRLYLSNRTIARITERSHGFRQMLESGGDVSAFDCQHIEQAANSYLGFYRGRRTYRYRRSMIEDMGVRFWDYFFVKGHFDCIKYKTRRLWKF